MDDSYQYTAEDLKEKGNEWNGCACEGLGIELTTFDKFLKEKWNEALSQGLFKYKLNQCQYKVLQNGVNLQFVAQLNSERGFNRRKRELFEDMNAPFAEERFNFTKIKRDEILFYLKPSVGTALGAYDKDFCLKNDHAIAINISPIDDGHILFVPHLSSRSNQKMTVSSLLMAFDLVQLSGHPGFRVGFNTLHAWASINHLHFHAMYFKYPLFLDHFPAAEQLKSHCFRFDKYAMRGLVFNISSESETRIKVAEEAIKVANYFHDKNIPFNAMITRGEPGTRMFIFPRKPDEGREASPCFDVACVEIGGQFPVKTKKEYDDLTFERAYKMLQDDSLSEEEFSRVIEDIAALL